MSLGYRNRKRRVPRMTRMMENACTWNTDGWVLQQRKRKILKKLRRLIRDENLKALSRSPWAGEAQHARRRLDDITAKIVEVLDLPLKEFGTRMTRTNINVDLKWI